jgi:hypothetical protein
MSKWFEEMGYDQQVKDSGEITCTCRWTTMEISRFPKDFKKRKDCKHIKSVREKLK